MLYVGIDVAKHKHDCFIMNSNGETVISKLSFPNDIAGFETLLSAIKSIGDNEIRIGLESTGHYGDNLIRFLNDQELQLMIFNPMMTNMSRKATSLRKTKNDTIDARVIASMLVTVEFKPYSPLCYHIDELKSLSRHRFRIIGDQTKAKVQLTRLLTITFPEYASFFASGHHIKTSYALLKRYSTPDSIIKASKQSLTNLLYKSSKGRFNINTAIELKMLAKSSIGSKPYLDLEIRHTISTIELLQSQIETIDVRVREIINHSNSVNLLSIPGINYVTAASILSEIGTIDNFKSAKQLFAYAGLDPSIYQSGKFSATITPMTKRGSYMLRYFLMNASNVIINHDFVFRTYYHKKRTEGKRHRTALVHVARKLTRVIYHLLKYNRVFVSQQ